MLKFLRRYNKLILVVGGSFLMVVFLLPQAIQQFGPNPMSVVHFRADGKTFRGREVYEAGRELQNLQAIQQIAYQATGIAAPIYPPVDGVVHWLLIIRDAEDLGLVGGPEGGRAFLEEIAALTAESQFLYQQQNEQTEAQKKQITDLIVEGLMAGRARIIDEGTPAEVIDRTLARVRGIRRLFNLAGGTPSLSTREAAYFGREFLDSAVGDIILIGVGDYASRVPEPTEQQLMAHFEKYKSVKPQDDEYGIGYLRPPAVRVETLQIDRSVIRNAIKLDPIEVNKFWRQNQADYGSNFQTALPNVEAKLRSQKVQEVMSKVEELLRREFFKATNKLPALDGGGKRLPTDWAETRPNYHVLAEQINVLVADLVPLGETQPATVIPGEAWLDQAGLTKSPAATAAATVGGFRVTFPQLALSVRELDPESKTGVQTGLTFGPVDIPQYRMFYFRVLEARPESPPESLTEVRDEVRRDYLRLRAYDLLLTDRVSIVDQIVNADGIEDLYERFNDMAIRKGVTITTDAITPPAGVSPLPAANKPALRDAVAERIDGWDPMRVASDIPLRDRIVVTPIPDALSVAFVLITGHHPMTSGELRRNDFRVLRAALDQWTNPDARNPFTLEALKERLHYVPARAAEEEEADAEEFQDEARDPNTLKP